MVILILHTYQIYNKLSLKNNKRNYLRVQDYYTRMEIELEID